MSAISNALCIPLTGYTGSGTFVGTSSPIFTTPILGAATAVSLAFSPTTNGIIGTTAADNASSGYVGEFISSTILVGSAVSIANNTTTTVTTISLGAGDWDVWGNVSFNDAGGTAVLLSGCINTTTVMTPYPAAWTSPVAATIFNKGEDPAMQVPYYTINTASPVTLYLLAYATITGTITVYGSIYARRAR